MIIKKYYEPKKPKIGETYTKKCFAILPKKIKEGSLVKIIIFQRYYKTYEYCEKWKSTEWGGSMMYIGDGWKLIKESITK